MGHWYKCSACDFQFFAGHSHHEGRSSAICLSCGQKYVIVTENPWGPRQDELCALVQVNARATKVDTGQKVRAKPDLENPLSFGDAVYFVIIYDMSGLICNRCQGSGTITEDLSSVAECPSCRHGRIVDCGPVEF